MFSRTLTVAPGKSIPFLGIRTSRFIESIGSFHGNILDWIILMENLFYSIIFEYPQ